ncbi:GLPGLI family protein [Jejuia pallidilutea]|uniref:GLPGLI family protein n=1 Tax=Jejuia pallidilutea TaxID=504487 RepID=A0A362X0U2_9FLAO|nr:GLPGLI family protein [Jejuia pallidilutea]PQV49481.1 GLPGLI family protein [Jejuia pallidilutea]
MIKKCTLFCCLLFVFYSFAQKDSTIVYEIDYTRVLHPPSRAGGYTSIYSLDILPQLEISIYSKKNKSSQDDVIKNDKDDDALFYYTPKGKNTSTVFKNYIKNKLFSTASIGSKQFVIEDSLSIFNWKILKETKVILGYSCQKATTSFRGRKYTAWFTSQLPVGGPWKFDGLPGMILEIKSKNSFIFFEAIGIRSRNVVKAIIKNPFKKEKTLSWADFKALYKKKAIDLSKYRTSSGNEGQIILSRMGIERYIEDNDTDYTADKDFERERNNKN